MFGAFDAPVGHLAFDDPGVLAWPALWERLSEDLSDRLLMGGVDAVGGKIPAWCGRCGERRGGCG
jgi:hypothetical protein